MDEAPKQQVAVLIRDLIFETKITSTAGLLGVPAKIIRSADELAGLLDQGVAGLVIVDLNTAGLAAVDAIRMAKTHSGVRVLAFVSHVDADLAAQATAAGADEVLPRSRFSTQLPALLSAMASQKDSGSDHKPL